MDMAKVLWKWWLIVWVNITTLESTLLHVINDYCRERMIRLENAERWNMMQMKVDEAPRTDVLSPWSKSSL